MLRVIHTDKIEEPKPWRDKVSRRDLASGLPEIYLAAGIVCGVLGATSLVGSVGFKSHLHKGHRVATVYTIRPKTEHFALGQIFMCANMLARLSLKSVQPRRAAINDTSTDARGLWSVFLTPSDWFFF